MTKFRQRGINLMVRRFPRAQEGSHRGGPEDDDHPGLAKEPELPLQVRLATGELGPRRLVLGRRAPHRRDDVAVPQGQSIVSGDGRRLIREAGPMQGAVQPIPASISREWAAGAVPSVCSWREPHDEESSLRIAEPWHGPAPVCPVSVGRAFYAGHGFAEADEPRTSPTGDDFRSDSFERVAGHDGDAMRSRRKRCAYRLCWEPRSPRGSRRNRSRRGIHGDEALSASLYGLRMRRFRPPLRRV
jgi:hypothetical protein